ncbi:MAG: site-specific integrase [Muribaculaceae bacterium]|nr:site-specific integrase [Muribaculaceae bacterium]
MIENIIDKINEVFYYFEIQDITPDNYQINYILRENKKDAPLVEALWAEFEREGINNAAWADNTRKSVHQVINLLKEFRPKLKINELTTTVLNDFILYQQNNRLVDIQYQKRKIKLPEGTNRGYANNVIAKHCNIIRRFLRWAVNKQYIGSELLINWKPEVKTIDKPVIFLTWEELMQLYQAELTDRVKDEVRDIFCFMCFTSLRYSDAINLKKNQIHSDYLLVVTQKTHKNIEIDLNKYSSAILEKYADSKGDYALPRQSNRDMNNILKVIAKEVGLNDTVSISQYYGTQRIDKTVPKYEVISTHCGRRTFVCNALSLGIMPHVVMKWTGHSNLAALKPYMDAADTLKREEMNKFNSR